MKRVYLDNAATTPVDPQVIEAMEPYFSKIYGNASEPHQWGQEAKKAIEESRKKIAYFLGAKPEEIIFTSCATESINLAHKGLVEKTKQPDIITTQIEHKAVLETCKHLEKLGMAKVTYLPVDKYGLVNVSNIGKAILPQTVLVSIMYVNNEVGTIEPIQEIGRLIKQLAISNQQSIYFHTDATQGVQYLDCNVDKLGVDLLSFTGHKFYAPKGIGALYVRNGISLTRQQDGGGQEGSLRAGTENVPYIVALGKAVELSSKFKVQSSKFVGKLRDKLIKGILDKIPNTILTGHPTQRALHIASFCFKGAEGEAILLRLDAEGIAASSGSACTSGSLEPSHVLLAMGIPPEIAHGSIRFSLGKDTTEEDIDYVLEKLPQIVRELRKMAPKL